MKNEMLLLSVYTAFWMLIREKKVGDEFGCVYDKLCDRLRINEKLADVLDKDKIFSDGKLFISELNQTDTTDTTFLEKFNALTKNWDNAEYKVFADILSYIILEDEEVSAAEKECLAIISAHTCFNMSLLGDLSEKKMGQSANAHAQLSHPNNSHPKSNRYWALRIAQAFSFLLTVGLFIFLSMGAYQYWHISNTLDTNKILDICKAQNKLVVKRATFSKFLIAGKPADTHRYLDKLNIFCVRGEADIQFPLGEILIAKETSLLTRHLVLKVPSSYPEVIVRIDPQHVDLLPGVDPQPIDDATAEKISRTAGAAGGAAGTIVGSKLGEAVGAVGGPIGSVIGGGIGLLLGGGGAGYSSYIMTKNFISGLTLESSTLGDKERLLKAAVPLIRLELLGGNQIGRQGWEQQLAASYKKYFESALTQLLRGQGWTTVTIVE